MKEPAYSFNEYRDKFFPRKCRHCGGSGYEREIKVGTFASWRRCRPCDGSGLPGVEEMMEDARQRREIKFGTL